VTGLLFHKNDNGFDIW